KRVGEKGAADGGNAPQGWGIGHAGWGLAHARGGKSVWRPGKQFRRRGKVPAGWGELSDGPERGPGRPDDRIRYGLAGWRAIAADRICIRSSWGERPAARRL